MKISRRGFVHGAGMGIAAAHIAEASAQSRSANPATGDFYAELVTANELAVDSVLRELATGQPQPNIRRVGANLEALAAAFCAPESPRHKSADLIPPMQKVSSALLEAQHGDGTIDSGNLHSPPDTGFVLETVCTAFAILRSANDPRLASSQETLKKFILKAGDALVTGGIHTPNHRWVVSAALARVNSLFPDNKYIDRIDDWLGEGIYCDEDGQYSERSTGIYSRVIDNALITIARLLKRPQLLEPVRRNLEMTAYYMHPNGEVETIGSRRQDQNMVAYISTYYLEYRYMALVDANPLFGAMAQHIERTQSERVKRVNPLINFLEEPVLRKQITTQGSLPTSYSKLFRNTEMARIRRDTISASVYGGSDWPLGVASGLASNPTFFTFRKGEAVLESVRLGCDFFSEGAFRSRGMAVNGSNFELQQQFEVPYYQPLPKDKRNPHGDYKLTPVKDARYWSKMDFPDRPMSNIQMLQQKVTVRENTGKFEIVFDITGTQGVPVAIELAFRAGGTLNGALQERVKDKIYLLREGFGKYVMGEATIEFGPGQAEHDRTNLSGHSYQAHGATLRPAGTCVYITGFTPFQKTLTIA